MFLLMAARRKFRLVVVFSLLASGLPIVETASATVSGDSARSVAREPQLQPDQLGNGVVDGLQYADPTEGLALVSPPVANSGGGAQVEYPFVIPPGRGITPEVSLGYDSGGRNGWVGLGWDLSVGEISVDTAFGAPHFDPVFESESYLLNGDLLTPNATDGMWQARVAERQDFTRQVETEYQQIIRHGNSPSTYFWEVHDKFGNVFWYGGKPDPGGPFGYRKFADQLLGKAVEIDTQAIEFDDNGNAVKWYLSAQRDVGVNQIRYYYTPVTYARTTTGWSPQACTTSGTFMCGRHKYLDHIDYTEAAEVAPDPGFQNDAPYRVEFQRESEVTPSGGVRPDPIVDASLGFVDVINDRLARVVVMYGNPVDILNADGELIGRRPRTYDQLAARYDLEYETGPFGKSLLSRVGQISTTSSESAWHEFRLDRKEPGVDDAPPRTQPPLTREAGGFAPREARYVPSNCHHREDEMPRNQWSPKRERQYEHIKDGLLEQGRDEETAEEIAAHTVNKERARAGESKTASKTSIDDISSSRRGGLRSHRGPGWRTREQLYREAQALNISGRSTMSKADLERAVDRRSKRSK